MELAQLVELVRTSLDDMKAEDIQVIDIQGKSSMTDTIVLASGTSTRHVKSLANAVQVSAKDAGIEPLGSEGELEGEWVLVDLNDVVVHVMLPAVRDFYKLEKIWERPEVIEKVATAEDE
ncbi:ribosome silencing factor [Leucothrix pacifica]|uniref:Ribosomal silencing factor RsfS n=1 Tax=Leucothrix pacifica TaxID=1247513 RepID=A0A317CJ50_9GAMM|nr:ribosome silencing factor [Leucothrix pacifica]PWQ98211.1 ribosome silencing factor [Leucothrix pacifica]